MKRTPLVSTLACLAVLAGAVVVPAPAGAQSRIYRCGNEYTNQIKGRTDCKLVEGGNVTIVRGTAPAAAPAPAPVTRSASTGAAPKRARTS